VAQFRALYRTPDLKDECGFAMQVALEKNKTTFAVLDPPSIFRADGHLEALRKLGYTVEEPL
jgi:hypothetical protein